MDTPAERKRVLLAMKADIMEQFESVKAKLDAVELLIASQDGSEPGALVATVEEARQACIEILGEVGMPIHRKTLLEMLEDRGVYLGGKVPVNNLGSILSRFSKDFESHGQGMWSINNKPTPKVSDPSDMNGHPLLPINQGYDIPPSFGGGYAVKSS